MPSDPDRAARRFVLARIQCDELTLESLGKIDSEARAGDSVAARREAAGLAVYDSAQVLPHQAATSLAGSSVSTVWVVPPPTEPARQARPRPSARPATVAPIDPSSQRHRVHALAKPIADVAQRHRIDPLLLHAMAHVESRHDTRARSPAGALGVMQVMPDTARRFGVLDPSRSLHVEGVNLEVGAAYVATLLERFDNDLPLVLAAYNAGEGAVERHGNRVPPFPETRTYVKRVLDTYAQLKRAAHGSTRQR